MPIVQVKQKAKPQHIAESTTVRLVCDISWGEMKLPPIFKRGCYEVSCQKLSAINQDNGSAIRNAWNEPGLLGLERFNFEDFNMSSPTTQ